MNNNSANKGFRTFILTLSVSLIVFSVIYYALTSFSSSEPSEFSTKLSDSSVAEVKEQEPAVQGASTNTVFGDLVNDDVNLDTRKTVLAGADVATTTTEVVEETPQSTTAVPETGLLSVTAGLMISLSLFVFGLYFVYRNPRKLALNQFEKTVLEDLD